MATIYVRSTGNDTTGNGSLGTPYLTLGKAITVAVAGDTINMAEATTFARGTAWDRLPDDVDLVGLDTNGSTNLSYTSTASAVANFHVPGLSPGTDSQISNIKITCSGSNNRACFGVLYISENVAGNTFGTEMGSITIPDGWTCTNCIFDGSGRTGSSNVPAMFAGWDADEATDQIFVTRAADFTLANGSFVNCTFISRGVAVSTNSNYVQTDVDTNTIPGHVMLPWILNFTGCTITSNNPVGTGVSSTAWLTSAVNNIDARINLYNCVVSATDAINGQPSTGTPAGSGPASGTKALFCGTYAEINAFGCTLTTSRPNYAAGAFDANVSTAKDPITAQIHLVGCTYNNTKTSGVNIIDVAVFPAEADVADGTEYGPNGDDFEGEAAAGGSTTVVIPIPL